jgi:hypothetical protein
MLKTICIVVLIVCLGAMAYSVWSAINTMKKNKATDEATRRLFIAKMQQEQANRGNNIPDNVDVENVEKLWATQVAQKQQTPQAPAEALDYDHYVDYDPIDVDLNGQNMRDFYQPD